ncbi:hypothetical protein [Thioclava kandeliae]|uniref:Uncharacterized protein n=1 Tax=Thioclava kandeliae TaxID=3070818 RepID=A0ABV1SFD7_9RHOB
MSRFLGEVTAIAGGQSFKLRLDMLAMANLEDRWGENVLQVMADIEGGKRSKMFRNLIDVVEVCLMRHHPDAGEMVAADILSEDPGVVDKLFSAASPKASEASAAAAGK